MIARYLIQRMGFSVSDALECITVARGHPIEREHYISNLGKNVELVPKFADGRDILRGRAESESQRPNKRPTIDKGKEHDKRHGPARDHFHSSREAWNDPSKNLAPWEQGRGPQTDFSAPREDGIRRPRRSEFIDGPIVPHGQPGNWGNSEVPVLHPTGTQHTLGPRYTELSSNSFIPERRNDYRNEGRRTDFPGFDPRVPPPVFPQRDLPVGDLEFNGRRPQRSEFVDDMKPRGIHLGQEDRDLHHQRLPPREWRGPPADQDHFGPPPNRMTPPRGRPRPPDYRERIHSPRRGFSPPPRRASPLHKRPSPHRNQRMSPFHGRRMTPPLGRRMSPPHGQRMSPSNGRRMSPSLGRRMSPPHGRRMSPPHGRRMSPPRGRRMSPPQGRRMSPPNDRRLSPLPRDSGMSFPPPPRTLRTPPPPVRLISPPRNIRPPSPRGLPKTPPYRSHRSREPVRDHLDMKYGLDIEPFPLARSPPRRSVSLGDENEKRSTHNLSPGPGRFRRSRSPVRRQTPGREPSPSRISSLGVAPRQAFNNRSHGTDKSRRSPLSLQADSGKCGKDFAPHQEKDLSKRSDPHRFEQSSSKQYDDQKGRRGIEGREHNIYPNESETTVVDYIDLRSRSNTPSRSSSHSKSRGDGLKSDFRRGGSKMPVVQDLPPRSGPRSPKHQEDLKRPRRKSPEENDEIKRRRPGTPPKSGKPTSEPGFKRGQRPPESHLETKTGPRTSDSHIESRRGQRSPYPDLGPRREQRTLKPHVGPRHDRRSPEPRSGTRLRKITPELETEPMLQQRSPDPQFDSRRWVRNSEFSMEHRGRYKPSGLPVEDFHHQSMSPYESYRGLPRRSEPRTPEPLEDPRQYEMRTPDYEKESFHTEEPLEDIEGRHMYEELPMIGGNDPRSSVVLRTPEPLLEERDRRPYRDYGHQWNRGGSYRGTRRPYRGHSMRGGRGRGSQNFRGPSTPEGRDGGSFAKSHPDSSHFVLEKPPEEFPHFPIRDRSRSPLFIEREIPDSFVEDEPDCRELLIEKRITTVTEEMKALSPTALDLIGPDDEIIFVGSDSNQNSQSSSVHRRSIPSQLSQRLPGRPGSPLTKKPVFERLDEKKPPVFQRLDNPPSFHNVEESDMHVHGEIDHPEERNFENQFRGRGRYLSSPRARFSQLNRGFRGIRSSSRGMYSSTRGMRSSTREMNFSRGGIHSSTGEMHSPSRDVRPPSRGMHSSSRGTGIQSRGVYSSTRGTHSASTSRVIQQTNRPSNTVDKSTQGLRAPKKDLVSPPAGLKILKKTTASSSGTVKIIKKVPTTSKQGVRVLKKVPSSSSVGVRVLKKAPSSSSEGVRVIKKAPNSSTALGVAKNTTASTSQGVRPATKVVKAAGKVGTIAKGKPGAKVTKKLIRKPLEKVGGIAASRGRK